MWRSFWSSFSSLGTIFVPFSHVHILGDNLPYTDLSHVQLTCDYLNSQPTITIHHLPYSVDLDLSPVCRRPPASGVIFHLLIPLIESLVPLKNICSSWCYLHTHAAAFQVLVTELFPTRPKISGLFIAWCSFVPWYS